MGFIAGGAAVVGLFGAGVYIFDRFTDDLVSTSNALTFNAAQAAMIGLVGVGAYVVITDGAA